MRYREIVEVKTTNTPFPGKPFPGLTPEFIAMIHHGRHVCRVGNGGGGACHVVSEWLEDKYGWERFSGTYLSRDGEVIDSGHLWNYLPDGSILDATADQHGEGYDIRVIAPNDPDYRRYRPEWSEDYHPGMANYKASWPHPHSVEGWTGEYDWDRSQRIDRERGRDWHVTDPKQWDAYSREQWKRYGVDNWRHTSRKRPDDLGEPEFDPDEQAEWDSLEEGAVTESPDGPRTVQDVAKYFLDTRGDLLDDEDDIGDEISERDALEIIRREYVSGTCQAFAIALHDKLGYPIVALNGGMHVAVRAPDGEIIDFMGKMPLAKVLRRYGMSKSVPIQEWSREETLGHLLDDEDLKDAYNDVTLAKWVLDHLGRWYY